VEWTDDTRIETPEQIDVALELAGLGSRFLAQALDWAIKLGTVAVLALLALVVLALLGASPTTGDKTVRMTVLAFLVALGYLFLLGYDIYFEVRHNGQTPGKHQAGLRVLRDSGAPVDFRTSCVRNLLAMADFLPSFHLLGGLLVLLTARHQRLGDLAAGTIVVRERVADVPADVSKKIDDLASNDYAFTAEQIAPCLPEGRHILRSFFQRSAEMDASARLRLARRLAEEYARKTATVLPASGLTGRQALVFLASLYRDMENLVRHGS
jgi:uncharacterized RDD family membrane protein YckC